MYQEFRSNKQADQDKENINDDLIFEVELMKQIEINIDYILQMIKKYHSNNQKDKEILADINRAINSSFELRNKKDLIDQFIENLEINSSVDDEWIKFVEKRREEELEKIIQEENLEPTETRKFIKHAFKNGNITTTGTSIAKLLPSMSLFSPDGKRGQKRQTVLEKLINFFERFFDISSKDYN